MKAFATLGTAVLFLSLGTIVPAVAQHEQEEAKPEQKQQQEHAQPQPQQHVQQQNQQKQQQQQEHTQQQSQNKQQRVQQAAWQGHQSQNWQSDHRRWEQRGGYSGYRIPDNRYNGYFGPDHGFVIFSQPYMVVGGFPRFQYGGYWFSLVDPWPGYWSNNWHETDDVYVVYANNGYYMYNLEIPWHRHRNQCFDVRLCPARGQERSALAVT